MNALHHLPSHATVLREMHRILMPGGRAVFSEPGTRHARDALAQFRMREERVLEKRIAAADSPTGARRGLHPDARHPAAILRHICLRLHRVGRGPPRARSDVGGHAAAQPGERVSCSTRETTGPRIRCCRRSSSSAVCAPRSSRSPSRDRRRPALHSRIDCASPIPARSCGVQGTTIWRAGDVRPQGRREQGRRVARRSGADAAPRMWHRASRSTSR